MTLVALTIHGAALAAQAARGGEDSTAVLMGSVRSWLRGRSLGNAYITLESVQRSRPSAWATSDSSGRFVLRVPAAGEYLLLARTMSVEAGGKVRMPVYLRGGDTVRIDLFLPPLGFDATRRQAQLDELASSHARWIARRPEAYRVNVKRECFCLGGGVGDWTLEVRPETTIVLRRPRNEGERPPIATVEAVFEWLETELRDPRRQVDVRYDAVLGYPAQIDTDTVALLTDMWERVEMWGLQSIPSSANRGP